MTPSLIRILAGTCFLTLSMNVWAQETTCNLLGEAPSFSLETPSAEPVITGNRASDAHLRQLARQRGYRLQSRLADPETLAFPWSVHHCVADSWRALRKAAIQEGYNLSIVSGYRSIERQRQIFLTKLKARGVVFEEIPGGQFDHKINEILDYSSIPGFSRHHSGLVIDLQSSNKGLSEFGSSKAYAWLSDNAFEVARQYGFLPSYPASLNDQGPEPEPWEFIWVGPALDDIQVDPHSLNTAPSAEWRHTITRLFTAISLAPTTRNPDDPPQLTALPLQDIEDERALPGG